MRLLQGCIMYIPFFIFFIFLNQSCFINKNTYAVHSKYNNTNTNTNNNNNNNKPLSSRNIGLAYGRV